ncbi:unnamed protein product, partial [Musa hybrid cultivar]
EATQQPAKAAPPAEGRGEGRDALDSMKILSRSEASLRSTPSRGRFACAASDRPLFLPHSLPSLLDLWILNLLERKSHIDSGDRAKHLFQF